MDILQLIDRLEELFNDGKPIPFTHNVAVDEDRMLDIIDQMRIAIPEEATPLLRAGVFFVSSSLMIVLNTLCIVTGFTRSLSTAPSGAV